MTKVRRRNFELANDNLIRRLPCTIPTPTTRVGDSPTFIQPVRIVLVSKIDRIVRQDVNRFHSPQVISLPSSHELVYEVALSYTVLNLAFIFVAIFEALRAKNGNVEC